MSKKMKRSRARQPVAPISTTTASVAGPAAPVAVSRGYGSSAPKPDLAKEYSYVLTDLKRIGLIAVAMFVLLFALAFVLK
jgi:hypothetical protein